MSFYYGGCGKRRRVSREIDACDQCWDECDKEEWIVCGDCHLTLCSQCADENRCDLCFQMIQRGELSNLDGYVLCECCIAFCDACENLSLCKYCKPDHLKNCNSKTRAQRTIASVDYEIETKENKIQEVKTKLASLQSLLSQLESALAAALKRKAAVERESALPPP